MLNVSEFVKLIALKNERVKEKGERKSKKLFSFALIRAGEAKESSNIKMVFAQFVELLLCFRCTDGRF